MYKEMELSPGCVVETLCWVSALFYYLSFYLFYSYDFSSCALLYYLPFRVDRVWVSMFDFKILQILVIIANTKIKNYNMF
jgi:hypothetical protein